MSEEQSSNDVDEKTSDERGRERDQNHMQGLQNGNEPSKKKKLFLFVVLFVQRR